jgi:Na+-transporting NADH:ubiquinone oxidoreductase subunit B
MSATALTRVAPHVRAITSLTRIQAIQSLALLPVLVAAVLNTGYQYLLALDAAGGEAAFDWRDHWVRKLGVDTLGPSAFDVVTTGLVHVLPVLALAIFVAAFWEWIFVHYRRRAWQSGVLLTAMVFTLLMPPAVSLVHVVVALSFAVIFAKYVFGGEGTTFLNPALVGVAIMQISFPGALTSHPLWTEVAGYAGTRALAVYDSEGVEGLAWFGFEWPNAFVGTTQGLMGTTSVLAVLLGGLLLLASRIASWRLILGQVLGLVAVATACNVLGGGQMLALPWHGHLVLGSFAFCAVFVATDPASSASINAGRWVQGLVVGALVVTIRVANPAHPDGVIAAVLLGSVLAPLIDHVVVWVNIKRRAWRHG